MNNSILKQFSNVFSILSLAVGLRLLAEIFLARTITLEMFGLYGLVISFVGIIQVYIGNGIRTTLLRHLPILFNGNNVFEFFQLIRKALLFFSFLAVFFGLFIYFSYGSFESKTYIKIQPHLLSIFVISCMMAFLYTLSDVFRSVGQVEKSAFFREFTVNIFFIFFLLVLWFFHFLSLNWIFFVFVVALLSSIIWGILSFKNLNLKQLNHQENTKSDQIFSTKKLLFFWLAVEVLGLIWAIRDRLSIIYVSEYLLVTDIAIMYVMLKVCFPLYQIKYSFNSFIAPVIATLFYEKKIQELNEKYQDVTKLQFIIIFPIVAILSFFGVEIVQLLLGEKYLLDVEVFSTLLWLLTLSIIFGPSSIVFQMCGKPNIESFFNILSMIIIVPLNILLIQNYGLLGLVLGVYGVISLIDLLKLFYLRFNFSIIAFTKFSSIKICILMLSLMIVNIMQPFNQIINLLSVLCLFVILFLRTFLSYINEEILLSKLNK